MIDAATKTTCACPLNGKLCIDGTREDFPEINGTKVKCRWWQHLYGKDPQTEKMIDQWDCAVAWLPITTIETSQMAKQTAAGVDKVANEVAAAKTVFGGLSIAIEGAGKEIGRQIEAGRQAMLGPGEVKPS